MNASTSLAALFLRHSRLILLASFLWTPSGSLLAQAANTNYTADMPSVERVKTEIKGSDPTDTLARQVAVLTYLQAYIDRIKYNRTVRGPYTPDELRLLNAYRLAAYQISQDYAKNHTPDEAKAFERLHGQYEMNSDFYKDWSHRLIGPQSAAAYHGMESDMAARQQAHIADINRQNQQAVVAATPGTTGTMSNDPTAVATRRCLELGGSSLACMGKGLGAGFMGLIGLNTSDLTGPGAAGVVLFGQYPSQSNTASLSFSEGAASTVNCGKITPVGYPYTIEKGPGSSLRVVVQNQPRPFTVNMGPDGGLTGPGQVDVTGRIIVGYHTVTHQLYVNGAPGCRIRVRLRRTLPNHGDNSRLRSQDRTLHPRLPVRAAQAKACSRAARWRVRSPGHAYRRLQHGRDDDGARSRPPHDRPVCQRQSAAQLQPHLGDHRLRPGSRASDL